jgi:hypothetical protein
MMKGALVSVACVAVQYFFQRTSVFGSFVLSEHFVM